MGWLYGHEPRVAEAMHLAGGIARSPQALAHLLEAAGPAVLERAVILAVRRLCEERRAWRQEVRRVRRQAQIAELPGWRLNVGGTSLVRGLQFPTAAVALAFLGYASEAARAHGRRLRLTLSGPRLEITLPAEGDLSEADLDFAAALSWRP